MDELNFNSDGTIQRVIPTKGLEKGVGNLNPFQRVEAETIAWEEGIETATAVNGEIYVTDIDNGDYIKVRSVDFKKGAKSFEAEAIALAGGSIEIRLDSKDGAVIGTCTIKSTGAEKWSTFETNLGKVKGVHDVYLIFKGGEGDLFNFNSWRFKKDQDQTSKTKNKTRLEL